MRMLVFLLLSMSCVGSTATAFTPASVLCRAGPNTRGGTYLRMEEPRPWPKMGATWPWQRTAGRGAGSARLAATDAQLQDGVIRYGRFRCAYRFKAPAPGHELDAPLVLVRTAQNGQLPALRSAAARCQSSLAMLRAGLEEDLALLADIVRPVPWASDEGIYQVSSSCSFFALIALSR